MAKKSKFSAKVAPKRTYPTDEQLLAFANALYAESDRGAILIGTAYLDNDLEALLREKFCKEAESRPDDLDWLLKNPIAPLKSFAVRIRVARALGLITEWERQALDELRELRNDFAHNENLINLSEER